MKLSTSHWLLGIGAVLTAVATGIATKLASDKVTEVRQVRQAQDPEFQDLTLKEKIKIYAWYEAIPVSMAVGVCTGIYQSYKTSQETIKIATNISTGAGTVINGYRDLTREAIGKKKEDEIYTKVIQDKVMPKNSPLILGEGDFICMIITPGIDGNATGIPAFISNATKIKRGVLDFNARFVKRVGGSVMNDASASLAELLEYWGVHVDNKILDHLGWTWQKDGPIEVSFRGGITEDIKPVLGIEFQIRPHEIY